MFDPSKYTVPKARPLPVILLLDCSGSMSGQKINILNQAVQEMIEDFKKGANNEVEINVAVITFGGDVRYLLPLQPASQVPEIALTANGGTPMGVALHMAKDLIEDKSIIPSKSYRPAVVLVSDGEPNDSDWDVHMNNFLNSGRSSKCERFALAIGTSKDDPVLNLFLGNSDHDVFLASEVDQIRDFFKFVTMTVSTRASSQAPNTVAPAGAQDVEDLARQLGLNF